MTGKALRRLGSGVAVVALATAGCGSGERQHTPPLLLSAARQPIGAVAPQALPAGTGTSPTMRQSIALTAAQSTLLRQVATRTWDFLSGPDLDPTTHLPLASVPQNGRPTSGPQSQACRYDHTNPALIGTYLSSIVAAKDLGLASPAEAEADAAAVLGEIRKLPQDKGFLVDPCQTSDPTTTAARDPRRHYQYVSTVDNGWLAQGLLVARDAFPRIAPGFTALLDGMQWQVLYDRTRNVLYNGYRVDGHHSPYTYDNAYSGPRIAEYMAIGSGRVPGALWWGPHRTPPPDHTQRQDPKGNWVTYTDPQNDRPYRVFEGHYTYDGITFVPTFDGSLYQALAPDLVFPEQRLAPSSLGTNDRNTALAQAAYGLSVRAPIWGWGPATAPGPLKYRNYGVPDLASDQGFVAHAVVAPYAAFLALPIIPAQAYSDIAKMLLTYPALYTRYGFLDSVDIQDGQIAARYMAASQMAILMSIDDAVDGGRLQTYVDGSSYEERLAPYMAMEKYSIAPADRE